MRRQLLTDSVRSAYTHLYLTAFDATVFRIAKEVSRADAEDITAMAFIRLYWQLERGDKVDDFRARLNAITEGLVKNHWRDKRRRKEDPSGLLPELAAFELTNPRPLKYEQVALAGAFDKSVRELAEPERDAFILTELRGLTVREAADVLDAPKSTVADRLRAARTYVRKELA